MITLRNRLNCDQREEGKTVIIKKLHRRDYISKLADRASFCYKKVTSGSSSTPTLLGEDKRGNRLLSRPSLRTDVSTDFQSSLHSLIARLRALTSRGVRMRFISRSDVSGRTALWCVCSGLSRFLPVRFENCPRIPTYPINRIVFSTAGGRYGDEFRPN